MTPKSSTRFAHLPTRQDNPFPRLQLARVLILALLSAIPLFAYAQTPIVPPGDGLTTATAYQISQLGHLVWMSETSTASVGRFYRLISDIDASETANWNDEGSSDTSTTLEGFRPIGFYSPAMWTNSGFRGTVDGSGHKVLGLTINRPLEDYIGLFGLVGPGGTILNLGVEGADVRGKKYVGLLVGITNGAYIARCHAFGAARCVGERAGLLVGCNQSPISDCYTSGSVEGPAHIGGLTGTCITKITNCFSSASVTGGSWAGGLTGYCVDTDFKNCYATGEVNCTGDYVGGLVGFSTTGRIDYCYSTGKATGRYEVGGLLGYNFSSSFQNIYWDKDSSGRTTSTAGEGKTAAEMKLRSTFVGWDFTDVWRISDGEGRPYLQPTLHTLTYTAGPGGSVAPSSSLRQEVSHSAEGNAVTAVGDSGYYFEKWSDGLTSNPRVDTNVTADINVTAIFPFGTPTATPTPTATTTPTPTPTNTPRPGQAAVAPPGDGLTTATAYQISQLGHLVWMAQTVTSSPGKYYRLMNEIDASGTANWNDEGTDTIVMEGFAPIGAPGPVGTEFAGIFEGDGHSIVALSIVRYGFWSDGGVGLFGRTAPEAVIRNLKLSGSFRGTKCGSLAGRNAGKIENCATSASLEGYDSIGGLVGENVGLIAKCAATGLNQGDNKSGGLVGLNGGAITDSHASVRVDSMDYYAGGLVGYSRGAITNCYATGDTSGKANAGGLVGYNETTITCCYATGQTSAPYGYAGGLVGTSKGAISNCFATGAAGKGYSNNGGGLVGSLVKATLSNCYASGKVTGGGGLVCVSQESTVTACYWNTESTSQSASAGGEGKTTAQMKHASTFVGWNFSSVWAIKEGQTYPYLRMPLYTLTYSADPNGSIVGAARQTVHGGSSGSPVTARPNAGFRFVQWSDGRTDNPRTDTPDMADIDVTAIFALISTAPPGDGLTPETAYQISQLSHLVWMQEQVADSHGKFYRLMNDIDASITANWNDADTSGGLLEGLHPIGDNLGAPFFGTSFRGAFDGGGHQIIGLTINRPDTDCVGLFGYSSGAVLKNIGLQGGSVTGKSYVGALVGGGCSNTEACFANTTVKGKGDCVGGLSGSDFLGSAERCYAAGSVTGEGDKVGGLIGWTHAEGSVTNCYATGAVSGNDFVGGLIGANEHAVANCYATGRTASSPGAERVGGIAGWSETLHISRSFWDAQSTNQTDSAGGGVTSKTTAQMKQQATFATWDFSGVWGIAEGRSYPYLRAFTRSLAYSAGPGGSLAGSALQLVRPGKNGTPVTARPESGFHFTQWSDGATSNPRTDRNVTADINVEASFSPNPASAGTEWARYR